MTQGLSRAHARRAFSLAIIFCWERKLLSSFCDSSEMTVTGTKAEPEHLTFECYVSPEICRKAIRPPPHPACPPPSPHPRGEVPGGGFFEWSADSVRRSLSLITFR